MCSTTAAAAAFYCCHSPTNREESGTEVLRQADEDGATHQNRHGSSVALHAEAHWIGATAPHVAVVFSLLSDVLSRDLTQHLSGLRDRVEG